MKCYYEELEVKRDASENDIKSAYRKLALKWHPDKNQECVDVAKERFQLIQQAYEILSDPQERAWYDNHREQIIRGKDSNYEDNCLNLFPYFTVSCFKGYGDDENGFYAVYQDVFKKISAEDAEYMDSKEEFLKIPLFGDSKSSYEEVVGPFYAYWSAYCTKRTYAWLCPYDIREFKDRRILRVIEKEMKKVVQNAKKERNEEVRNLVSFLRKRDRRVQAFSKALEERTAFNRQKQERNRMDQKRRRQQELEEMRRNSQRAQNDDYEEQLKQLEIEYSKDYIFEDDNAEELVNDKDNEQIDGLYCVACNKEFKTERSFANHETSKKHRDNVEKLKIDMINEESFFLQEEKLIELEDIKIKALLDETEDIKTKVFQDETETKILFNADDTPALATVQNKTKKKKEAKNLKQINVVNLTSNSEENVEKLDLFNKMDEDDGDWETRKKKILKNNKNRSKTDKIKHNLFVQPSQTENEFALKNKILKPEGTQLVCETCKASFESKNKLFSHLKQLNHAVFLHSAKNSSNENTKIRKSKRVN